MKWPPSARETDQQNVTDNRDRGYLLLKGDAMPARPLHYEREPWITRRCDQCAKLFLSIRSDARFCSGTCRQPWRRAGPQRKALEEQQQRIEQARERGRAYLEQLEQQQR